MSTTYMKEQDHNWPMQGQHAFDAVVQEEENVPASKGSQVPIGRPLQAAEVVAKRYESLPSLEDLARRMVAALGRSQSKLSDDDDVRGCAEGVASGGTVAIVGTGAHFMTSQWSKDPPLPQRLPTNMPTTPSAVRQTSGIATFRSATV